MHCFVWIQWPHSICLFTLGKLVAMKNPIKVKTDCICMQLEKKQQHCALSLRGNRLFLFGLSALDSSHFWWRGRFKHAVSARKWGTAQRRRGREGSPLRSRVKRWRSDVAQEFWQRVSRAAMSVERTCSRSRDSFHGPSAEQTVGSGASVYLLVWAGKDKIVLTRVAGCLVGVLQDHEDQVWGCGWE